MYRPQWSMWRERFSERATTAGRWERPEFLDNENPTRRGSLTPSLDSFDDELRSHSAPELGDDSEHEWDNWEREYGGREAVLSFDFDPDPPTTMAGSHGYGSFVDNYVPAGGSRHVRDRSVTVSASPIAGPGGHVPDGSGEAHGYSPGGTTRIRTKSFTNALPVSIRPFGGSSKTTASRGLQGSSDKPGPSSRRVRSSTVTNPVAGTGGGKTL